ncbi:MAG: hypothetical protein PHV59_07470 [Victivallales bacterium]|nr:hypothetical protein [Victivallales bacterium]
MKNSVIIKKEPSDQGPIYQETDTSRFPVEPWATYTNLIFLAVFILFAVKTRFSYRKYPMTVVFLPVLFAGWLGGTVYHATRSHNLWLKLDYMPIMFLVLMASIFFWHEAVGKWFPVLIFTLTPVVLYRIIYRFTALPHSVSISIGYSILALTVIIPLVLHCIRKYPAGWKLLCGALTAFILAIVFRTLDDGETTTCLPMGTHFLWHIFGGLCTFFMFRYLYDTEKMQIPAENQ